jgi:peptidyl-dipeptidase Dcp
MNIVKKLVNLRLERAQLLGYATAADFVLTQRMAKTSDKVYELLNQLLEAYSPAARQEVAEVQALAKEWKEKTSS